MWGKPTEKGDGDDQATVFWSLTCESCVYDADQHFNPFVPKLKKYILPTF